MMSDKEFMIHSPPHPKIVVMIPAYNEEETIGLVISDIRKCIPQNGQIIVVDDGSTDYTAKNAKDAGADEVISHHINKGLGVAFQTGIAGSIRKNPDVIVNIDADGQFDPIDIPKLIQPIIDGKADMVTCTRFSDTKYRHDMSWVKSFGNNFFTSLINYLTKQKFTDTQCGFRAYSRECALRMTLFGRFTYTQEVFFDLITKGMKIVEVPCTVKGERNGKSRMVKSIFSYGSKALYLSLSTFRDFYPLKFFGGTGLIIFSVGFIIGIGMVIRYLLTGLVLPYASFGILSMVLLIIGFLFMILALIADMFTRQRKLLEEILYYQKRQLK